MIIIILRGKIVEKPVKILVDKFIYETKILSEYYKSEVVIILLFSKNNVNTTKLNAKSSSDPS